ncbi:MAG: glycine cleavage system aminomethyltransferase GcvT, partial [Deltaproteobacteria bacterium]|nr:glycine cleavage system aminomethyltransferase GcvT [Deltaproteobacteria bacterium]
GMKEEHIAVRSAVGLFDISHLGQIEVSGPKALEAVQLVTTNDASKLTDNQIQYSLLCNPSGGIIDDVTIYMFNENRFIFGVNAVNADSDLSWLKERIGDMASVVNLGPEYAALAIQGPLAQQMLQNICDADLALINYYHFTLSYINGVKGIVSRIGYTGEDGFEIYIPVSAAEEVWISVMEAGKDLGIKPCGLGARDSLRLDMGYTLYGNDISVDTTPLEAGLERFVKFQKRSFIGKEVLQKQAREGIKKRLTGFEMVGRGVPRRHYPIHAGGKSAGEVTSGGQAPSLNKFIGMGYLERPYSSLGTRIEIEIRGKMVEAVVVKRPFYKT